MKLFNLITLILLCFGQFILAQDEVKTPIQNAMSNVVGITGEGGITLGITDYDNTKMDYTGKVSLEYYFPSKKAGNFGLRIFGQTGFVAGTGISSRINPTDEFSTKFHLYGGGIFYSYSLGDNVYPWIGAGVSQLWFYPKDKAGNYLPNTTDFSYKKYMLAYNGDIGARVMISKKISVNLACGIVVGDKDVLDDFNYGLNEDLFLTATVGVSYNFGRETDADGDGVPNINDACPNTPKGVKVDEFGCPLDTDHDGVADSFDECPDTPVGIKVDASGCPIENIIKKAETKTIVLGGDANFGFNETKLFPNSYTELAGLVNTMKENPDYKWEIGGYSDSIGTAEYNNKLSEQRAQSVADYLISKGVNSKNLKIRVYGKENPIATNETEEGRAKNRRVEIKLLSN